MNNSTNRIYLAVCLAVVVLAVPVAFSATPFTETFDSPESGWQKIDPVRVDGMVVTREATGGRPDGVLRLRWNPVSVGVRSAPPVILPDSLIATGSLGSVHFIGDLVSSEAWLIGFDIKAVDTLPDYMYLAIHSGSNLITRTIMTAGDTRFVPGNWYSMRYTLLNPPENTWAEDQGALDEVIRNVTRVSLVVKRRGETKEDYLLDNIFIDRLPAASAASVAGSPTADGSIPQLAWGNLRYGDRYLVQATHDLVSPAWETIADFVAGEDVFLLEYDPDSGAKYFRILQAE